LPLEELGGVCIASSEIDNDALNIYRKNWSDGTNHNLGDICKIDELPDHDLIVGGVPCQSWSIAGKNKGTQDPRGRLWYEVIRLVGHNKPKAFIFENVKGLSDPRHRDSLNFLIDSFTQSNYKVYFKVLNSYDFGVPQNRDRIYIVGIRNDVINNDFCWPQHVLEHKHLYDILDIEKPDRKPRQPFHIQRDLFGNRISVGFNKLTPLGEKNPFFVLTDIRNGPTSVHSWEITQTTKRQKFICITMMKHRRKLMYGECDGNPMSFNDIRNLISDLEEEELEKLVAKNILKRYEDDGRYEFKNRRISGGINGLYRVYLPQSTFFSTLTASGTKDVIATKYIEADSEDEYKQKFIDEILNVGNYRSLTSDELMIIQGFPRKFCKHTSDQKNIKLFGNSVSVPVIKAIGQSLIRVGCFDAEKVPLAA
jgi:DNA (cytosine-5)-methyltransferase 1